MTEKNNTERIPTANDVKRIALETIEQLRNRSMKVDQANAISKLCNNIISTVHLEIEATKLMGREQDGGLKNFLSNETKLLERPLTDEEANQKRKLANESQEPFNH